MKKQTLVRTFLMSALLVGFFVIAGDDVYAQDGGALGSGGGRSQIIGSGAFADGGMLGSGTVTTANGGGGTIGSGTFTQDNGGLIGSGTRIGLIGSGGGRQEESSFFYTMLRYFGF
ncbi:MAG TPA: hypothetical protein VF604_02390 [Pyrinomonadaceae bacterium]|jgi:hypothetical protein